MAADAPHRPLPLDIVVRTAPLSFYLGADLVIPPAWPTSSAAAGTAMNKAAAAAKLRRINAYPLG